MRLNVKAFALTCGLIWGLGLFLSYLVDNYPRLCLPHITGQMTNKLPIFIEAIYPSPNKQI